MALLASVMDMRQIRFRKLDAIRYPMPSSCFLAAYGDHRAGVNGFLANYE